MQDRHDTITTMLRETATMLRPRIGRIATRCWLSAAIAGPASTTLAQGQDDGYFTAAVGQLTRTVNVQRDGSHLQRLFALRRLGDPSLDPLFHALVQHGEWQVQVHAVLGLAENAPSGRIDPWLLTQLKPEGQDAAIATALDLELMAEPEIRELLKWDGLLPMSRLLLATELNRTDDPALDDLEKLAENPDLRIAGLASVLLLETGREGRFSSYRDKLASLPGPERARMLAWQFEVVRQYELASAGPWLIEQLETAGDDLDERTTHAGLQTALEVAQDAALPLLRRTLAGDLRVSTRVRLMQMLLTTKPTEPAWAFEHSAGEDNSLLDAMAVIGLAQLQGADEVGPLCSLIDLDHPRSTQWAIEYANLRMVPEQATAVFEHVIDRSSVHNTVAPTLVIVAATNLYRISPETLLGRLDTAEDDSAQQEMLLLGLLDVHDQRAATHAQTLRRIGAGRADVLALLLIASGSDELADDDVRRLGVVAAGGGRVAEGLQAQAAWLYLKRTNRIEQAMAGVLD